MLVNVLRVNVVSAAFPRLFRPEIAPQAS